MHAEQLATSTARARKMVTRVASRHGANFGRLLLANAPADPDEDEDNSTELGDAGAQNLETASPAAEPAGAPAQPATPQRNVPAELGAAEGE